MDNETIKIELYNDGFTIIFNGEQFMYSHEEDDYGTKAFSEILRQLGYNVEIEEVY